MSEIIANVFFTVDGTTLRATLCVTNKSSNPVYLEKSKVFANGIVMNHLFHLSYEGVQVRYIGIMAKLREPQLEDFMKLEPGDSFEKTLYISNHYEFLEGKHQYCGFYKAYHSLPNADDLWELQSDKAKFVFPG